MEQIISGSSAVMEDGPVAQLHQGSIRRQVFYLAWPVLLYQLLIFAVGLSDRLLAGRFHEEVAYQAAQNTAQYLAWTITSYTVIVSAGATALVARLIGAGERETAVRATNQAILLAAAFGLLGSIVGFVGVQQVIAWLQLRDEAGDLAFAYLRPFLLLVTFQMIEMAGIGCLFGNGDTRTGTWVLGCVALLNVPLAWVLHHGLFGIPGLGFPGIALGTALSHVVGASAVLFVLARGRGGLQLRLRLLRPDPALLWRLMRVGVPAGVDSMSVAAGHLCFLSIVNQLGIVAGSAHGIALGWEAMAYLSGAAFGTAAMTLVGQNLGAKRPDLAARSGWTAFGMGCAFMCVMGLVFFALAPQMFLLFCPQPSKAPVIEIGVPVLRLVAFAMPAAACCFIFTGALRGAGDTAVPVIFTWVGFVGVRIPLAFILTHKEFQLGSLGTWPGFDLGLFGAWMAMFADLCVRGAFFLARFAGGKWKRVKV
jgi:putative MATE family efflux protein